MGAGVTVPLCHIQSRSGFQQWGLCPYDSGPWVIRPRVKMRRKVSAQDSPGAPQGGQRLGARLPLERF